MKIYIGFQEKNYVVALTNNFREKRIIFHVFSGDWKFKIIPGYQSYSVMSFYKNLQLHTTGQARQWHIRLGDWDLSRATSFYEYNNSKLGLSNKIGNKTSFSNMNEPMIIKKSLSNDELAIKLIKEGMSIENKRLYNLIKDKETFDYEFESLLELKTELEIQRELEKMLENFIERENAHRFLKEEIVIEEFYKEFPEKSDSPIGKEKIESLLLEELSYIEEMIIPDDWYVERINREEVKQEFYLLLHSRICKEEEKYYKEKLKEKYNIEAIKKMFYKEIEQLGDNAYIYHLENFLSQESFDSEKKLVHNLCIFFDEYNHYEKQCRQFIDMYNGNKYMVELTDDKKERFYDFENNRRELSTEEEKEYQIYKYMLLYLKSDVYIKGKENKLKPTFQRFPLYMQYVKELINELIKIGVLLEEDNEMRVLNADKLVDLPENMMDFYNYQKANKAKGKALRKKGQSVNEKI